MSIIPINQFPNDLVERIRKKMYYIFDLSKYKIKFTRFEKEEFI